jgi:hypothetical protein
VSGTKNLQDRILHAPIAELIPEHKKTGSP